MLDLDDVFSETGCQTLQVRYSHATGLFTATMKKDDEGKRLFIAASGASAERSLSNLVGRSKVEENWVADKTIRGQAV